MLAYVLANWVVRGIRTAPEENKAGITTPLYQERNSMLRVAVSLDDERIVAAFPDEGATRAWTKGDLSYFRRHLAEVEVRNGLEGDV